MSPHKFSDHRCHRRETSSTVITPWPSEFKRRGAAAATDLRRTVIMGERIFAPRPSQELPDIFFWAPSTCLAIAHATLSIRGRTKRLKGLYDALSAAPPLLGC